MTKAERDAEYDAWMAGLDFDALETRLRDLGVTNVVVKRLADHQDNSQNQFYWIGRLTDNPLPLGDFVAHEHVYRGELQTGYKASLRLEWLTPFGTNPAPKAQLIHYPRYPETRLGSLLDGALYAPRSVIGSRRVAVPGRVLLFGVAEDKVIGAALPPTAPATPRLLALLGSSTFVSWPIAPQAQPIDGATLLSELRGVYELSPIPGCKIAAGVVVKSTDQNASGTTLETVLGVKPNARDEPDFHGWELKVHRDSRVTLMTPAPTGGAIKSESAEGFMRKFGWINGPGTRWDFGGAHRANHVPGGKATTRLRLTDDAVELVHKVTDEVAMSWEIAALLTHWSKKHARAAYVRRDGSASGGFTYGPHVQLGEGIDWKWFRDALSNGIIALDPAYKWIVGARSMTKARAQFRCHSYELGSLYPSVTVHDVRHATPERRLAHANLAAEGITLPSWVEP